MKYHTRIIPFSLFLLVCNTGLAAEPNIDELKTQQKQLQSLLHDIEKATQQRAQHSQQIQRLKHQLECNWTLIRSYEICAQLHEKNPQDHVNCSSKAKRTAALCLSSDQSKTSP